ncbi:hypothetical protein V8G54_017732, partial [Vigna mungo]
KPLVEWVGTLSRWVEPLFQSNHFLSRKYHCRYKHQVKLLTETSTVQHSSSNLTSNLREPHLPNLFFRRTFGSASRFHLLPINLPFFSLFYFCRVLVFHFVWYP